MRSLPADAVKVTNVCPTSAHTHHVMDESILSAVYLCATFNKRTMALSERVRPERLNRGKRIEMKS
jgi:hypothetical protein